MGGTSQGADGGRGFPDMACGSWANRAALKIQRAESTEQSQQLIGNFICSVPGAPDRVTVARLVNTSALGAQSER
jgi:hypothetical protein